MKNVEKIVVDLGLNLAFVRNQDIPVTNCWHFTTDGRNVDAIFCDDTDFIDGMNRIYVSIKQYDVTILAFCLMDTHVHFILYGDFGQCNLFVHDYVKRTSSHISMKYGTRHKLRDIPINHQLIDTDTYLKAAICYVLRNPQVAGLNFNPLAYPWSSGALMFCREGYWTSPNWDKTVVSAKSCSAGKRSLLKTRLPIDGPVVMISNLVFPGEYVNVAVAERIFRTPKSFAYFMGHTKEMDIESRGGVLSLLSIPIQEMRQHKTEVCREMYGRESIKTLNVTQRLHLAKTLKARYGSSPKQLAALCGLMFSEVKDLL